MLGLVQVLRMTTLCRGWVLLVLRSSPTLLDFIGRLLMRIRVMLVVRVWLLIGRVTWLRIVTSFLWFGFVEEPRRLPLK